MRGILLLIAFFGLGLGEMTPSLAGILEWIPCGRDCKAAQTEIPQFDSPKRITGRWPRPGVVRLEWERLGHLEESDQLRIETRSFGGDWVDLRRLPGSTLGVDIPGFERPKGHPRSASKVEFRVSRFREFEPNRALFHAAEYSLVLPGEVESLSVFVPVAPVAGQVAQILVTPKDADGNPVVHFTRTVQMQFPGEEKRKIQISTGDVGTTSLEWLPKRAVKGSLKIWWKPGQKKPSEFSLSGGVSS